jgi:hypothetical protein
MPIRQYLGEKWFDPDRLDILNRAFLGACADLGVTDKTPHSREAVAKMVIELADGQREPETIRTAVVAFLKSRH